MLLVELEKGGEMSNFFVEDLERFYDIYYFADFK